MTRSKFTLTLHDISNAESGLSLYLADVRRLKAENPQNAASFDREYAEVKATMQKLDAIKQRVYPFGKYNSMWLLDKPLHAEIEHKPIMMLIPGIVSIGRAIFRKHFFTRRK